jgi:hypothetical protein
MDYVPNIVKAGWATLNCNDNRDRGNYEHGTGKRRLEDKSKQAATSMQLPRGATTFGCLAQIPSFVGRLTVLSSWLMGFHWEYLRHWERRGQKRKKTDHTEVSSEL